MASTVANFCLPTQMVVVSSVFILLSDVMSASDLRQCYWCGPLAEQVHRSRRAPSCDDTGGDNVTTCDAGYTHCAMVVTGPPYVESRYCVKLYQDECYSLYCSSTNTWRIICPCRGDFCNGEKTERETEAFASLAKLRKTQKRIKKRTAMSNRFVRSDEDQTIEPSKEYNNNDLNNLDTEQNMTQNETIKMDVQDNELNGHSNKTDIVMNINENKIEADTTPSNIKENSIGMTPTVVIPVMQTEHADSETTKNDVQPAVKIIQENAEVMLNDAGYKAEEHPIHIEMTTAGKSLDNLVKPTEELPTAEALQQNGSPVMNEKEFVTQNYSPVANEKENVATTELTTIMTTRRMDPPEVTSTKQEPNVTPTPNKMKKNSAGISLRNLFLTINCLFFSLII